MGVYGRPGTGLKSDGGSPSWAASAGAARWGAQGEARTAALVNPLAAELDIDIFHDIMVPNSRGQRYNADHGYLVGNHLFLFDSKMWKPGFYWTVAGRTFRGTERFRPAEKASVRLAQEDLSALLGKWGCVVETPRVLVWSSSQHGQPTLWAARYPGAKWTTPEQLKRRIAADARRYGPPDPDISRVLRRHLAR